MPAQELLRREQEGVGEQPEASEAAAAAVDGARAAAAVLLMMLATLTCGASASSPDVANTAHTQNSGTRETVLLMRNCTIRGLIWF